MGKILLVVGTLLITIGAAWLLKTHNTPADIISPLLPKPTPLIQYTMENLRSRTYSGSQIVLEKVIKKEPTFTSYLFSFTSEGKKVTGQANLPAGADKPAQAGLPAGKGPFPVILMNRGYVDKEVYFTGVGTRKAAGEFAKAGFITLAPDFLGFGGSDPSSSDILETRFEKPITVINLFQSIETLSQADKENVFMWGHSNGGQVSLLTLEILQKPIPTVLWAPVTRSFPESVLDYVGELDDQGRMVVASISAFVETYDKDKFSVTPYLADITAPFQINQGTADVLVKEEWTAEFVKQMKNLGKDITYYVYPKNDHNLSRDWDLVVARNIQFYKKHLKLSNP
ncbi:hypothetical protein HY404_03340 [Candidatus Microgenomates bacterium]|nr:hypothetical protein [Candidatus Microgenomates bacterium]